MTHAEWQGKVPGLRKEAVEKSRAVLSGQFSEQLAPYLPDFSYKPTECKFLGKPVDFIVFKGLDDKNVEEIVFVEVKSGGSTMSTTERRVRDAVVGKKVRWEEYRVPERVVKRGK
ncbi:hypothetical protein J4460_05220 [Candidatus Woesearchaeota archaeon]|nr:hypothetical protein [Candidatus Woesearchaeota archaeon]HIH38358.1 hypothetical protein [Candidatus Woesearchaeota archaeon]HIH48594.1 hypothetical protein [Candidatus Woesearchaeota archaeon]HIJ03104.1 hypothetical protein [Candidatus Woesearchaeota archaeon]